MRTEVQAAGFGGADRVRTIRLHGDLGARFGARHRLKVETPAEAVRALCTIKKGFRQALSQGTYQVIVGSEASGIALDVKELEIRLGSADLHIIPVIEGQGALGRLIAGIALIGVSFLIPGAGISLIGAISITANSVFGVGLALALGGVAQLLSPTPKAEKRDSSNLFGGVQSTTVQGSPVPLIYGRKIRVDPIPISSALVVDNGKDAFFHVVDLLGEGEIGGLYDGLKSVYLDQTPLQNADGSLNFEGVEVTVRTGTVDQDPLPGFEAATNEVSVGTEVKATAAVVRAINDANADAARITIRTPSIYKSTDSGLRKTSVQLAIDVQPQGGSYVTVKNVTIEDKSQAPRDWQYRVELAALGGGPWNIKVRRITEDATDETLSNQTFWSSYTEIVDHRLSYPRSAVVGIKLPAEAFGGSIPSRFYVVSGRKIEVPVNFDPDTRNFTGEWDGTFKRAVTDDPAWVLRDIATDRAGFGDLLKIGGVSAIDKWGLYEISQYAAGVVPDGFGGTEFRYSFNGVLQSREDGSNVLQAIASAFRGIAFWGDGGQLFASADMPSDPVLNVTPANTLGGVIDYPGTSLQDRHTVFLVSWRDPDNLFEHAVEVLEDPEGIQRFGYREASLQAVGCTSRGLAARFGRWALDTEKTQTQGANYAASFDHAQAGPGELIQIADKRIAGLRMGGRIRGVVLTGSPEQVTGVVIDAPITIEADKSYTLSIVNSDGAVEQRSLTNSLGSTDTLTFDALDGTPIKNAMWAVAASDLAPRQFRILGIRETAPNKFDVASIFHDPTKFQRVEQGLFLDAPSYTALPTGPLSPPSEVEADDYLYVEGGTIVRAAALITWSPSSDARVISYQVHIKPPNLGWSLAASVTEVSVELNGLESGVYDFRVRGVDAAGRTSAWATKSSVEINPFAEVPSDVTGLRAVVQDDITTLSWNPNTDLSFSHYVVKFGAVTTGATWGAAIVIQPNIAVTSLQVPTLAGTYLVKAVSLAGLESANAAAAVSPVTDIAGLNAVETFEGHPTWAGDKVDVEVVSGGILRLSAIGGVLDWGPILDIVPTHWTSQFPYTDGGLWTQDGYTDLGDVYTSRLTAKILASGENVNDSIGGWATLGGVPALGSDDADQWSVRLEISHTQDDPSDPETEWTDWSEFVVGDFTARAFKFRMFLFSLAPNVTPIVAELVVTIDMPDRVEAGIGLTAPDAGTYRVSFTPHFRSLQGVAVSKAGAVREVITNKDETGFDIRFLDVATAVQVETDFDFVAKGYGRRAAA